MFQRLYQLKLLNLQVNVLNYFVKQARYLISALQNNYIAFISNFLHSSQEYNGNVGTCQTGFTVTVTLDAAHSELVTMPLNTG